MFDITFYVSIVSGLLLTISEALPYISNIKANGIMELVINTLANIGKKQLNEEHEPLLPTPIQHTTNNTLMDYLNDKLLDFEKILRVTLEEHRDLFKKELTDEVRNISKPKISVHGSKYNSKSMTVIIE